MSVKLGGHGSSRGNAQHFLLSLSEFCINQILGRSYFSLRKGDLFSIVSLQTMIGMGMVEREAVGQVGGGQKLRR